MDGGLGLHDTSYMTVPACCQVLVSGGEAIGTAMCSLSRYSQDCCHWLWHFWVLHAINSLAVARKKKGNILLCHSSTCLGPLDIRDAATGAMLGHEELRWQLLSSSMMVHLLPLVQEVAQHACMTLADTIRRSAVCPSA